MKRSLQHRETNKCSSRAEQLKGSEDRLTHIHIRHNQLPAVIKFKMRAFFCVFVLLLASVASSLRLSGKFSVRPGALKLPRPMKLYDTPKYEIVPVDKPNIENAAAVTGGIVGFVLGGPVWGVLLAAVSNYVVKKEDDSGEALRGFGKVAIESYNFLNKVNSKYDVVNKATTAATEVVESVAKNADSEVFEKVKKTYAETVTKLDEINKEYELVSKSTAAVSAAAQLSDTAIEKVVELNNKVRLFHNFKDFQLKLNVIPVRSMTSLPHLRTS